MSNAERLKQIIELQDLLAAANARADKADAAYDRMNTQRVETERALSTRLERVRALVDEWDELRQTSPAPYAAELRACAMDLRVALEEDA